MNSLPENWKEKDQKGYTQKIGNNWYQKKETLLLQVPSAIIDMELNYMINTTHPDFNKVSIAAINSFMFDNRIKS